MFPFVAGALSLSLSLPLTLSVCFMFVLFCVCLWVFFVFFWGGGLGGVVVLGYLWLVGEDRYIVPNGHIVLWKIQSAFFGQMKASCSRAALPTKPTYLIPQCRWIYYRTLTGHFPPAVAYDVCVYVCVNA